MEKREIRIDDKWYSVGDTVEMESTKKVLFWKKKILRKYKVVNIVHDNYISTVPTHGRATLVSEDEECQKMIIEIMRISQI